MNETSNQLGTEMGLSAMLLVPEILNTILLVAGIVQMYHGIEISHPLYLVLFCNLVASLISSLVDVIAFPILTINSFEMLLLANGVFYMIFHCTCWQVVSILRYVYIVHPDWIGVKIPEEKNLCRMSLAFVLIQYSVGLASLVGVLIISGWPHMRVVDMPEPNKVASTTAIVVNLCIPVIVSVVFTLLLIVKRGKIGLNKIDAQDVDQRSESCQGQLELGQERRQEVRP